MNNQHISYSFSNHFLYISESELHRSTSRLQYLSMNNHHVFHSFLQSLFLFQEVSYIEVQVDCVLGYE